MAKLLGVGGVFFKAKDPAKLGAWYQQHLGIPVDPSYGGAELIGKPEDYGYGLFGWFLDPEGNKVELWEPKAKPDE